MVVERPWYKAAIESGADNHRVSIFAQSGVPGNPVPALPEQAQSSALT